MVKRTIEISPDPVAGPAWLNVENDQLVITRGRVQVARVPIEDIGYLILNDKAVSFTVSVMTRIIHHGGIVMVCDDKHTPAGLLLSMHDNDLTARRIRMQAGLSAPRRKRLWQQIVRHKVTGQALNLPTGHRDRARLLLMVEQVQSGDRGNIEGQAARFYWPAMMGETFRRDPDGQSPNGQLNYGYMVLRSACCRAIVGAGLHPVFSLQHSHRNNTFALADDLVELFRPRVDRVVKSLVDRGAGQVDRDVKRELLGLLAAPVVVEGQVGPLMVQLARIVSSLVECIQGERVKLDLPEQTEKNAQKDVDGPKETQIQEEND